MAVIRHQDVFGACVAAGLAALVGAFSLRVWDWRPGIPLSIVGDSPLVLTQLDDILVNGWFWNNDAIGFPFGAVPAGGAEIPTFLSYATEKKLTKHPEDFGQGAIERIEELHLVTGAPDHEGDGGVRRRVGDGSSEHVAVGGRRERRHRADRVAQHVPLGNE